MKTPERNWSKQFNLAYHPIFLVARDVLLVPHVWVERGAEYEGDRLMDAETLATVRTSGLERELNELAQVQARVGIRFDVPRKHLMPSSAQAKYRSIHSRISLRISGSSTWAQSNNSMRSSASFPYFRYSGSK